MNRDERWQVLLESLASRGRLNVEDTAAELSVSPATIRRDLDALAQQQMLTRTRGGAVSHSVSYDLPLRYKVARRATEKLRIGRAAAGLVGPGAVVGLNGGTTTTEVARALAGLPHLRDRGNGHLLTIVTNALNIANELIVRPHIKIVVLGGVARPQSYELIGPMAAASLNELSLDIAFLGVDGIDVEHGASAFHEGEAYINRLIASQAHKVFVVTDSTKIGRRAFSRICPLRAVDGLITDDRLSETDLARFEDAGLQVTRV